MWKNTKIDKIIGILLIIVGLIFLLNENIALFNSTLSTTVAYVSYSVSELAVPVGFIYNNTVSTLSPYAFLINIAFICLGIMISIGNFVSLKKHISKYKPIFYLITLVLSVGMIIVAVFHTGGKYTEGMHCLGASMLFFGGSFLLLFVGLFVNDNPTYKKISLALGIIGLICGVTFCLIKVDPVFGVYRGIIERGNIYATIIWVILTGICLNLKDKSIHLNEK